MLNKLCIIFLIYAGYNKDVNKIYFLIFFLFLIKNAVPTGGAVFFLYRPCFLIHSAKRFEISPKNFEKTLDISILPLYNSEAV